MKQEDEFGLTEQEMLAVKEMFNTEGWKVFMSALNKEHVTLIHVMESLNTPDSTLRFCQGRIAEIQNIVHWESTLDMQEQADQMENSDADL